MLGEDRNTRASLTQAASLTPGADPLGPALDYLISCAYTSSSNQLMLLAGNNQGAVGCFPVAEPSCRGGVCSFGGPKALMSGAHDSVSATLQAKWLLLAKLVSIWHDISIDQLDMGFSCFSLGGVLSSQASLSLPPLGAQNYMQSVHFNCLQPGSHKHMPSSHVDTCLHVLVCFLGRS